MTDILVIGARGIPGVQGGLEKHAEAVFPFFADDAYRVTLFAMKRYVSVREFKGVHIVSCPTIDVLKSDKILYNLFGFIYAAVTRPRLVHLQGLNAAMFLVFYRLAGLRTVIRYSSQDYLYPKWGWLGRYALLLAERQLTFAHRVIAVSKTYSVMLAGKYGLKNISVVPNGVDRHTEPYREAFVANRYGLAPKRYVLSVGRITPEKDYETLIRAFLTLEQPDLTLAIAGGSGDFAFSSRVEELASGRVRFLGMVPREDIPHLYRGATVYSCASLHEGQSNAVLEAIAAGCPVIASDIPANVELNLAPQCYFRAGDQKSLADALRAALNEPTRYVIPAEARPNWQEVYRQTRNVYLAVCPELGAKPETAEAAI